MQWKWKGPYEGGITQSLMVAYEQDPFSFVLYYGLGLEEPAELEPNLPWGTVFHKGLEVALENPKRIKDFTPEEWALVRRAVLDECKFYPQLSQVSQLSILTMLKLYDDSYKQECISIETEVEFRKPYTTQHGSKVHIMGKVDGYCMTTSHTPLLLEHKCKGSYDRFQFRKEAETDLQINLYAYAMDVYNILYDNITIPELKYGAPKQQVQETHLSYINRLYNTHQYGAYPVIYNKLEWLDQYPFSITKEFNELYRQQTIDPIIDQICELYEYCSQDSFDIHNPTCFNKIFYKRPLRLFDPSQAPKFKKKYWLYLTNQLDFENLKPVEHLFKELSKVTKE